MPPLLIADKVYRHYRVGTGTVQALAPISLTVNRGDFIVVRGASGSGKSTLMALLAGLEIPSGGQVKFLGRSLHLAPPLELARIRNRHFGFVFQSPHMLHDRTVIENVMLAAHYNPELSHQEAKRKAHQLLSYVGLETLVDRRPRTLSGGELQRAAFARALLCDPDILFADEPTGNLDADNSHALLEMLRQQCQQQRAVVMVTHDELAMIYGTRTLVLDKFHLQTGQNP